MFENMTPPAPDSLMEIGRLFRADKRQEKIDLGVGTYRDGNGLIRVMAAVKEAEGWHLKSQAGKGYLGPGGDRLFCELLADALFPKLQPLASGRIALLQTPGGTGAYRLGLELAAFRSPSARLIVGTPTWPNHIPVAERAGMICVTYRYYDSATGQVDFDAMREAIYGAQRGDLLLVHGCCHNPTGASLARAEWEELAAAMVETGVLPVIDLAYAGMSRELEEDAWGARFLLETLPEAIVAVSCSKSFGLYNERTGMLAVLASSKASAEACRLTAEALARSLWSNPPDHGAAIVRAILSDKILREQWLSELGTMRGRLAELRALLAASKLDGLQHVREQEGLFAVLPYSSGIIDRLRNEHAIYMDRSGRINIAGLNDGNIRTFLEACRNVSLHPCNA